MQDIALKKDKEISTGILLTSDMFYPNEILGSNLQLWQKAGVKAVEMESATLFTICELRGVDAGAIVVIDGNPLDQDQGDMTSYNPHSDAVEKRWMMQFQSPSPVWSINPLTLVIF